MTSYTCVTPCDVNKPFHIHMFLREQVATHFVGIGIASDTQKMACRFEQQQISEYSRRNKLASTYQTGAGMVCLINHNSSADTCTRQHTEGDDCHQQRRIQRGHLEVQHDFQHRWSQHMQKASPIAVTSSGQSVKLDH
jgi:hypothetical protein